MIYQYVKRYLKDTFSRPSINQVWSTLDNLQFFNYLYKRYNDEEITKEISEIKEAFRDFFEPVGTIVFRYSQEGGIKFKIFAYKVEPKNSKHLNEIISIINKHKKAIIYPYKNQTDQIAITGTIRRKINLEVNSTDESVNKRELIKYAIRKALELGERDVIVQLKRMYLVKIFDANKITKEKRREIEKREGLANRYNGYTKEEIEDSYNKIFGATTIDEFLIPVMKNLFSGRLNFAEINNSYYEENALKIIQSEIGKELVHYLSMEEDFIFGLAGYIFREHFYKIHELLAIELLEQIYHKNSNAETFLHYYTDRSIIVENGRKYMRPSLDIKDEDKWTNSSVLGLSALWINTRIKIEKHKKELLEIERKIAVTEEKYASAMSEIQELNRTLDSANEELKQIEEVSKKQVDRLTAYSSKGQYYSTEANKLKFEVESTNKRIKTVKAIIKNCKQEVQMHEQTSTELDYYKEHHKKLQDEIRAFNTNIETNRDRINHMLEALTNALISRKKLIEEQ